LLKVILRNQISYFQTIRAFESLSLSDLVNSLLSSI